MDNTKQMKGVMDWCIGRIANDPNVSTEFKEVLEGRKVDIERVQEGYILTIGIKQHLLSFTDLVRLESVILQVRGGKT